MRCAAEVHVKRQAGDVLSEGEREHGLTPRKFRVLEYLPQNDLLPSCVRDLDTDDILPRYGGDDPYAERRKAHCEVAFEGRDPVYLYTRRGLVLEHGNYGSGPNFGDLPRDGKVTELLFDELRLFVYGVPVEDDARIDLGIEKVERRELVVLVYDLFFRQEVFELLRLRMLDDYLGHVVNIHREGFILIADVVVEEDGVFVRLAPAVKPCGAIRLTRGRGSGLWPGPGERFPELGYRFPDLVQKVSRSGVCHFSRVHGCVPHSAYDVGQSYARYYY